MSFASRTATVRQALVERDGDGCAYCGVAGGATTQGVLYIDHKTPTARGGSDDLDNLQLLCGTCNTQKGRQTDPEAHRAVRWASSVARAGWTSLYNVVLFDRSMTPQARLLYAQLNHYAFLCEHAGADSPEQAEIAANLGVKERALRPYIAELVEAKLLKVMRRGRGLSNVYKLLEPTSDKNLDRQKTAGLERQSSAAQNGSTLPLLREGEDSKTSEAANAAPARSLREQQIQELWDAFEAEGMKAPPTKSQRASYAKQVRECHEVGWTPATVRSLTAQHRVHPTLKDTMLTIFALTKWAGELESHGDDQGERLRRRMAERGVA